MGKKLVHGVGINNADYEVRGLKVVDGLMCRPMCPYYSAWSSMLNRCYGKKYQQIKPTYIGCYVCAEWLTFSNFKSWMEKQNWKGKHLDKDILVYGNKEYSPTKCMFVDPLVNTFFSDAAAIRGEFQVGVCFSKSKSGFIAYCGNPFTKRRDYLGVHKNEKSAGAAWLKRKMEHADKIIESQDASVKEFIKNFYHRTAAELVNARGDM